MTYITQHLSSQELTGFKTLHRSLVFRNALNFAVNALKRIHQIRGCNGRVGNDGLHLILLSLEIERLSLPLPLILILILLLVLGTAEEGTAPG